MRSDAPFPGWCYTPVWDSITQMLTSFKALQCRAAAASLPSVHFLDCCIRALHIQMVSRNAIDLHECLIRLEISSYWAVWLGTSGCRSECRWCHGWVKLNHGYWKNFVNASCMCGAVSAYQCMHLLHCIMFCQVQLCCSCSHHAFIVMSNPCNECNPISLTVFGIREVEIRMGNAYYLCGPEYRKLRHKGLS